MPSPIRIPDFSKSLPSPDTNLENQNSTPPKKIVVIKKPDYVFRGLVFGILSIFMLIGAYFVYNYALLFLETKEKAEEQRFVFENPLVRGDRSRVISLEAGVTKETVRSVLIQALKNEKVSKGEISIITPSYLRDTIINGERKLVSEPQRGDDFFFTFAIRSPLNLRTIASEKYALGMVGITDDKINNSENFFMFSVKSAPDALREMLNYENQIYYDMKEILELREIVGEFKFKNLSDQNQLLRVGYDDNGIVLVYGFPTPRTVLVTPNTETYQSVIAKLK